MTYNFNPDQWFVNELRALQCEYREGNLTRQQYEELFDALDQEHTRMWHRLDGTYRIP